jgi:hypothetical protein
MAKSNITQMSKLPGVFASLLHINIGFPKLGMGQPYKGVSPYSTQIDPIFKIFCISAMKKQVRFVYEPHLL